MYDIEKFYQAVDVKNAIRTPEVDPSAVIISGGNDVLIKIWEGKFADCSLVSIHGVPELEGVRVEEDRAIVVGPATTLSHVTNNDIIMKYIPILGNAVNQTDGPQLYNIRTVDGNVYNGVTSTDNAPSSCVLDAILVLERPKGTREVSIRGWYIGLGRTVRGHEEVLTTIKIRRESYEGFDDHYIEYGKRNTIGITTLGCTMTVKLNDDKRHMEEMHLSYGMAAPTPTRCSETEEKVKGTEIREALYETVGRGALEEVNPRSSWRASKEFRLQLVEEPGKRALK